MESFMNLVDDYDQTSIEDIKGDLADTENLTGDVIQAIEEYLKRDGQQNIGDFLDSVNDTWADEVKENYTLLVKVCKDQSDALVPEATLFTFIASVAGTVGLTDRIIEIFKYGTAMIQCKLVVQALVEFSISNIATGIRLLRYFKSLSQIPPFRSLTGFKLLKLLKWGGISIAGLSLLVDAGLGIYPAFAGAENKPALQGAIKGLCMRRFTVQLVKSLHSVYQNMLGNAKNFIAKQDYYNKHLDQGKIAQETYDKKIKHLVEDAIEDMKDASEDVDFESAWEDLAELDTSLKAFIDEDFSESDLKESWESGTIKLGLDQEVERKFEEKLCAEAASLDGDNEYNDDPSSSFLPNEDDEVDYEMAVEMYGSEAEDEPSDCESE